MKTELSLLILGAILVSCDGGSGSPAATQTTDTTRTTSASGRLEGTFKSEIKVKDMDLIFTFGPGDRVVFDREDYGCIESSDTGTASLGRMGTYTVLAVDLTRGVQVDPSSSREPCPRLLPTGASKEFGGPFPFRWITQDSVFEIQADLTTWLRSRRI